MTVDYDSWGQVLQFYSAGGATLRPGGTARSMEGELAEDPPAHARGQRRARETRQHSSPEEAEPVSVHPRMLDRQMQATLGRQLRALFDNVARSPVPDKFLKLLLDLESKEKEQRR